MNIKIAQTNKAVSARGGLVIFDRIFEALCPKNQFVGVLPEGKIASATDGYDKLRALAFGFVAGADCLDDMDRLACDPAFAALHKHVNAANTYGEYLRAFEERQVTELNRRLIDSANRARKALAPKLREVVVDIDSTLHHQSGSKMEGLAFNYNHDWGLDSLQAFDQFGFQMWMQVRRGDTFTANDAPLVITEIARRTGSSHLRKSGGRMIFRMDSGLCNHDVFNACYHASAKFVTAMRANMLETVLHPIRHWRRNPRLRMKGNREVEVGQTIYKRDRGEEILRVVVMRARKINELPIGDPYDYLAFITNLGEHQMTAEQVVNFYRQRGNAENFIREIKNGFDLHHLPCLKLLANKAYGLIGAFAYNLMRFASWTLSRDKQHFAKIVRFRMVNLACQVIRKARQVTFRFHSTHAKEVSDWINAISHHTQFLSG
jgi:hypothetical protein